MNTFLKFILSFYPGKVADLVADEIKAGISPLAPFLRRLSMGVVIVLVSVGGWLLGLLGLVITLFLYLADLSSYVLPALYTSLICWAVALILVFVGFRFLRKPR